MSASKRQFDCFTLLKKKKKKRGFWYPKVLVQACLWNAIDGIFLLNRYSIYIVRDSKL